MAGSWATVKRVCTTLGSQGGWGPSAYGLSDFGRGPNVLYGFPCAGKPFALPLPAVPSRSVGTGCPLAGDSCPRRDPTPPVAFCCGDTDDKATPLMELRRCERLRFDMPGRDLGGLSARMALQGKISVPRLLFRCKTQSPECPQPPRLGVSELRVLTCVVSPRWPVWASPHFLWEGCRGVTCLQSRGSPSGLWRLAWQEFPGAGWTGKDHSVFLWPQMQISSVIPVRRCFCLLPSLSFILNTRVIKMAQQT